MAHVEIHGRGIAFFLTEITPEIAAELAETSVSNERFDELFEEELDRSDDVAAGVTSGLRVLVDGEEVSVGFDDVDDVEAVSTSLVAEPGKYYLLIERVAEGCLVAIDTEEPFDPFKLSKGVTKYILPDETSITLAEFDYDASSEFGSTLEKDEYYNVIYPNGSRQSVIFSDGGESQEAEIPVEIPVKAKRATAKRATAKKATAKRATAKKATAKRATAKRATAKRATVKKATAKKAAAKKAIAKKATAQKAAAKKSTAKKAVAKKASRNMMKK